MAGTADSPIQRTPSSSKRPEDDELRPYVIVGDLGKGSFATVYKGYNEETRHEVAIKTVSRSNLSTKLFENLQSEIDILKSLSHRHITKLIDIVRAERNIYLIMEYCSGGDLTNYIKKRGRVENLEYIPEPGAAPQYFSHPRTGGLAEIVVRSFLRQLARALKFLRQRNLIHRDIKPQNLLLRPPGDEDLARGHPLGVPLLKVADFGFARSLPNAMMAETLCGSPLYMAPEILSYQKYDAKADLWSVGAVLYEMSVGKAPFRASNHIELLKKIDHSKGIKFPDEDPSHQPRPGEDPPQVVPSDIKALIRALLRRIPAERASFEDFFKSEAMTNSKFPRPVLVRPPTPLPQEPVDDGKIPEHHMRVPPEVLDPRAMIPPSKFNFRRRESEAASPSQEASPPSPHRGLGMEHSPVVAHVTSNIPNFPISRSPLKPLSTEGSIIPGETEEDGLLRREYVLVGDTQAVEFNRAVDEINAARRRPLLDRRVPPTPISINEEKRSPDLPLHLPPDSPSNATFPPPPVPGSIPIPTSRSATNALSRALTLASKKLFGAGVSIPRSPPHFITYGHGQGMSSQSPRMRTASMGGGAGEIDPVEDELLGALEQLAQKTHVITRWADEMYEFVKSVPQKPLPDPSKFVPREDENEKLAARRRNADVQAEYNAVTCVAIYMLVMQFAQKGIDELRKYQEHMEMRHPEGDFVLSDGFDEALGWFKDHFLRCHDRAALVKTWLPALYAGPTTWVDELVYNRALTLSRTAARKELLDQHKSPDECERLYEESLWCLYALQDDLLQKGNPFMEEDRETIATWIKRTKLRLVRCRARMEMPTRERLRDARADKNLDDVARIPAPWDAEALEQFHRLTPSN
ncbi:kinase-like domain-containing protein [Multifurca ochricompacta]|uniref:non-specific serine/threonine protein kinase n=1 Tax=Multifurca ochricompacta TaxID=376703 RepID=A0AAD4LXG7_9AGAM|nr:kinase-like domain-containing protein [Multifurca ochricompacta]